MKATIKNTIKGSIAEEAGIENGDILLSINGHRDFDILYYRFLSSNPLVKLEIQKKNGDIEIIDIINEDFEDIGIEFENELIDKPRGCRNKCIFCFVDQLPKGMRKTLYFKDDDYRLSALCGNYISLSNLSEKDVSRIIEMRLPRINISVHAVDPQLRAYMLGNKNADVLGIIKRLGEAKISMNCQIVLCRGINDGEKLYETATALSRFYPDIQSVSVVPVGLTCHRHNLTELVPYDKDSAKAVIDQVTAIQKELYDKICTRFVFPSDEFYLKADMPIPDFCCYEDFLQLENGVGLIASLKKEFETALGNSKNKRVKRNLSIATGQSAAPFIKSLIGKLDGSEKVKIYTIKNTFFGENITVAGLITGQDLTNALKGKDLGNTLLIPRSMLNYDNVFLDDMSLTQAEEILGVKIMPVENDGCKLFKILVGRAI